MVKDEREATHTHAKGEKRKRYVKLSPECGAISQSLKSKRAKISKPSVIIVVQNFICGSQRGTAHLLHHIDNGHVLLIITRGNSIIIEFRKDRSAEGSNLVPWKFD